MSSEISYHKKLTKTVSRSTGNAFTYLFMADGIYLGPRRHAHSCSWWFADHVLPLAAPSAYSVTGDCWLPPLTARGVCSSQLALMLAGNVRVALSAQGCGRSLHVCIIHSGAGVCLQYPKFCTLYMMHSSRGNMWIHISRNSNQACSYRNSIVKGYGSRGVTFWIVQLFLPIFNSETMKWLWVQHQPHELCLQHPSCTGTNSDALNENSLN